MLHFETFADLDGFTHTLQTAESDTAQVHAAYTALGIDVYAETLPNLTDYPVCLLQEQAIGTYTSARKAEETVINAALNSGDSTINSIVMFPFWKTALNADHGLSVGTRIYKYYDNGGIAIVLNQDWTLYESIRTLPFESLRESYNLIVTSDAREGWSQYFTFNADSSIASEKKLYKPRFSARYDSEGKLNIVNDSWIESSAGANVFQWIYSDHSSFYGINPNRTVSDGENITLVIDGGNGVKDTLNGLEEILACTTEDFTITYLSNNQIKFELPGYIPGNPANLYSILWVFSNSPITFGNYNNPCTKTFTSNGTATCKLLRTNGSVACEYTKPFYVKCGDKKTINATRIINVCNQRWKLDGSVWVQTGEIGCKVKYLKWYGALLGWKPANNDGSHADLSGTYIREVYNPNKNCIDITASGYNQLGYGTWPTTISYTIPEVPNVFSDPGQLSAGLGINVCGVWHGWGYEGVTRLVLP